MEFAEKTSCNGRTSHNGCEMQTHAVSGKARGQNAVKCRMASRAALLILCASTSGCVGYRSGRVTKQNLSQKPMFPLERIELQHLGCLDGGCPVYTVAINQNGVVNYHGYMHVAVTGHRRGMVPAAALRQLRIMLNDPAVFWLRSRYTPGNGDCGVWAMNGAIVRIEIDAAAFRRKVTHYQGCHGAPALLTHIEDEVDKIADTRQWVRIQVPASATRSVAH